MAMSKIFTSFFVLFSVNTTHTPDQVHIAFGSYPDSMVVMWAIGVEIPCHVTYWNTFESPKHQKFVQSTSVIEHVTYINRAEIMVLIEILV